MRQIAEELAAVRVIAHVLNNGATIGKAVRLAQLFGSGIRKTLQEQGLETCVPRRINDGFMRKDRVCRDACGPKRDERNSGQQCSKFSEQLRSSDNSSRFTASPREATMFGTSG